MASPDERQMIRDAMDRLLSGRPIRSDGALTGVSLAAEAGVKRHLLTHRHTDLRDEFYARVRRQGHVPQSEVALRAKVNALEETVAALRGKNADLLREVAILRRMNNVLQVERANAEGAFASVQDKVVTHLFDPGIRGSSDGTA